LAGDPGSGKHQLYRIANYLERQARQRGYQLLIACSEDQPDNEMRCIEHLLQRQVDAIIVSTSLPPEHPFISAGQTIVSRLSRWTARWIANTSPALWAPIRTMPKCWRRSYVNSRLKPCCIWARFPELSVSFLREQGFRTAWKDDPREVHFLYANSYERKPQRSCLKMAGNASNASGAVYHLVCAVAGGDGCDLRREGKLPSDLAIATFGDNELLDFLQCPFWRWHSAIAMWLNACWRLCWQAWMNRVNRNRV
jgi:LacI family fructose operon transcriptional repressor